MFERTWRFRDTPGSMLVRVSVGLSPTPWGTREDAAAHFKFCLYRQKCSVKFHIPIRTVSKTGGRGKALGDDPSSNTPCWTARTHTKRNWLGTTPMPHIRPLIKQEYPLNLSILISGGKETNSDSPSNGE